MTEHTSPETVKSREFVFLLTQDFSMMAFAAAIEPLRQANRMSRRELFSWRIASEGGGNVAPFPMPVYPPGGGDGPKT